MATEAVRNPADLTLLHFLDAQRASVIAIVEGLSDEDLRKPVVPSGWTPLGLIEHLGGAEYYWFQIIAAGGQSMRPAQADTDEDTEDDYGPFRTTESKESVFGFYRDQCDRSNALLAETSLSAAPRGPVHGYLAAEIFDLRGIVLHMIEETARHAGHLDIARELLDGKTGLGPR
jgi:uncharacterized damage-inducible protein DinB